ncbi:EmrB/QacA subfamily drug resistance transporter [Herbihabitans rhizosphaerae]|uniref:EmrB/QacA subfamily drug resistance transporter n=1 Tax=Herbihabitans rhizosphaerae TaxID=1872711 RepID=A0A4Q7KJA0_9PSEU|nr:DHA2 family efflux MFS transporter permease subunit [Herbihabitans rhizosphaerae]RZS36495.1 EmrB/QacA subfamily drug resistance transporter [Herbihabitans rhizosphaerae]
MSTQTVIPPSTVDEKKPGLVAIGAVVVIGIVLSIMDATIVNVATRTLGTELNASLAAVQWVLTGYLLAVAAVIPISGWAVERFGAKRVWIAALALFTAGSAASGLAWSVESLIVFRVLQGIGGGLLSPVGQAVLAKAAGPERMGRVMSMVGLPMFFGSVAGPIVGGLIVQTTSWRWIFFVNLPLGVLAMWLAHRLLPRETVARQGNKLDARGLALLSGGMAAFVYGLSEAGSTGGFGSAGALGGVITGAVLIVAYVVHARIRRGRALIELSLFAHRGFTTATITNFVVAVALFGMLILLPLYWQVVRGATPLETGLLMVPQALGAAAAMPLAGRFTDRLGSGFVVPVGVALALAGTAVFTQVGADTPYWVLAGALFLVGLGLGGTIMPSMAAAYASMPQSLMPKVTGALNAIQRLGSSLGTAAMAIALQRGIAADLPSLGGGAALGPMPTEAREALAPALADVFGTTFWLALALAACALVPALLLPRRRAEQKGK